MAFATGHTARTGFVAGQLKDGDSFGTIAAPGYGGGAQPSVYKLDLRFYKNTLIVIGSRLNNSGTVIEQPTIVPQDWVKSVQNIILPNTIPALKTLADLTPTASKITSLGLTVGGLVPVNATGDLMPYQQDADGNITSYVSPADTAKQQADAAKTQTDLLNKLTTTVTSAVGGGTSTTDSGTGMSTTVKIVISVAVAAVVGVVIYMVTRKKKGKK